jgi:hypothetical protein
MPSYVTASKNDFNALIYSHSKIHKLCVCAAIAIASLVLCEPLFICYSIAEKRESERVRKREVEYIDDVFFVVMTISKMPAKNWGYKANERQRTITLNEIRNS